MPARIAFVTYRQAPRITPDDALLFKPLADLGLTLMAAAWDDPTIRWTDFQAVILRSAWDYYLHWPEFMAWVGQLEAQNVNLWNPPSLVRWNSQKTYLLALQQMGVPIIPSLFDDPDSPLDLAQALQEREWQQIIVKPVVGAAAHQVVKLDLTQLDRLAKLREEGPLVIQPFMPQVVEDGEWSLIFFRQWTGQITFSHAVLKRPAPGDIRVQARYGGTHRLTQPSQWLLDKAWQIVESLRDEWLYVRLDGVWVQNELLVMEMELIEPLLFFQLYPPSAQDFASAIYSTLR
jgi:glutathione synthase/RimK-type ligase-like ATP-grasp enzyme